MCFVCFCVLRKQKIREGTCFVCFCVFFSKVKTEEGHVFCVFLCLLYKNREIKYQEIKKMWKECGVGEGK